MSHLPEGIGVALRLDLPRDHTGLYLETDLGYMRQLAASRQFDALA